jgi:hypothetical protein
VDEVVPHEPEAFLAGGAEEVDDEFAADGDAAEVEGDGGGRLVEDALEVVDPDAGAGEVLLGAQRGYSSRYSWVPMKSTAMSYALKDSRPDFQPRASSASSRETISTAPTRSTRVCAFVVTWPFTPLLSAVTTPMSAVTTPV